jgi:alkanesulfonate monooxygenase SsuD/methylene tetrahydromethanopterin reductase-like flavin-dependent oxidoreductase (luciferase family)
MEFGIFLQAHCPDRRVAEDPGYEHTSLLREVEISVAADKAGFKYIWASEHHFLEEYSHLSASQSFLAFVAGKTERIHVATGIRNLSPKVNNPVTVAEEAAMMDHLTEGRFELGTGRGAGAHEVAGFDIPDTSMTKPWWNEVIRQLPKMWADGEYEYEGDSFVVPGKRKVLPKPYLPGHPPLWVAAGNPQTFTDAGALGLGVIGFSHGSAEDMRPKIEAYKEAVANAEPVGAYVNDNTMTTTSIVCLEDGDEARRVATDMGMVRLQAGVYRYHTTFPKPDYIPDWPKTLPEPGLDGINKLIEGDYILCGTPEEVAEGAKAFEAIGVDQLCFGLPIDTPQEVVLETIRLMGEHVIPQFDTDPVHRSTRMREAAA